MNDLNDIRALIKTLETNDKQPQLWFLQCIKQERPKTFLSFYQKSLFLARKCHIVDIGLINNLKHENLKKFTCGRLYFFSIKPPLQHHMHVLREKLRTMFGENTCHQSLYSNFYGSYKELSIELNRYFMQYLDHIQIDNLNFVVIKKHYIPLVHSYLKNMNDSWESSIVKDWTVFNASS
jgi:hypothetical protein